MSSDPLFALLIPGRPLQTDFLSISPTNLLAQVAQPLSIQEFTICLLKPTIQAQQGVGIYYSLSNNQAE
jgi:hypothetical protein